MNKGAAETILACLAVAATLVSLYATCLKLKNITIIKPRKMDKIDWKIVIGFTVAMAATLFLLYQIKEPKK